MKTIVLGLFDQLDHAREVLAELSRSPLDLDLVELVNSDIDIQHNLAAEAGLPLRRGLSSGLVAGAFVGAIAGYLAGTTALVALGPLLATAGGTLLGMVVGVALAAISETNRVPPMHRDELELAVSEGATAIIVRTDNLPTARAIGDLFRLGGSRELSPLPGMRVDDPLPEPVDGSLFAPPEAAGMTIPGQPPATLAAGSTAGSGLTEAAAAAGGAPPSFAPPVLDTPESAPTEGEPLFAPPWRRGAGGQEAVPAPGANVPLGNDAAQRTLQADMDGTFEATGRVQPDVRHAEPIVGVDDPATVGAPSVAETKASAPEPVAKNEVVASPPAADAPSAARGLRGRVAGALERAGLDPGGALQARIDEGGEATLVALPGVGPVAVSLIRARMGAVGLTWPDEQTPAAPVAPSPSRSAAQASPAKTRTRSGPPPTPPEKVDPASMLLGVIQDVIDENG